MITVSVAINGQAVTTRSAVMNKELPSGARQYKLDCGTLIDHNPAYGPIKLAKKMLDAVELVKSDAVSTGEDDNAICNKKDI